MLRFLFWMFMIGVILMFVALCGLIIIPTIIVSFGIFAGILAAIVALIVVIFLFLLCL